MKLVVWCLELALWFGLIVIDTCLFCVVWFGFLVCCLFCFVLMILCLLMRVTD